MSFQNVYKSLFELFQTETYKNSMSHVNERYKDVNENIESNHRSLHPKACFQVDALVSPGHSISNNLKTQLSQGHQSE